MDKKEAEVRSTDVKQAILKGIEHLADKGHEVKEKRRTSSTARYRETMAGHVADHTSKLARREAVAEQQAAQTSVERHVVVEHNKKMKEKKKAAAAEKKKKAKEEEEKKAKEEEEKKAKEEEEKKAKEEEEKKNKRLRKYSHE